VATTSNAIIANNAVGGYAGSNVALNKLADAVVALGSSPAANRAGNQLLAEPHNNATALAVQPSLDVLNVITGHADSTRLAMNGSPSGVSAGESGSGLAAWGEGFGGGSHQSQDGQFSGYSMSSQGMVAGVDAGVADSNARVGGVFTYTHGDLKDHGDRTGDTMGLNSYGVLGYASLLGTQAYVDLLGGVLFDKFDTVRVVNLTGFSGVASGSHDGTQYVAKAAGGYRLPMGETGTTLTPVWGVTYSHLNQDAYTESGGNGAALRVASEGDNSLKGEAGLKLEHSFAVSRGDVVPEVKVVYRHEFDDGAQLQTASFAADESASTFSTLNVRPIENSGVLSTGVTLLGKDGVSVTLKYSAEAASGYLSQGGSLRVRWAF
jgi:outer membrane autotransporter protein